MKHSLYRRAFLWCCAQGLSAAVVGGLYSVHSSEAKTISAGPTKGKESADRDKWLKNAGITGIKDPIGTLNVSRFADSIYFLLKPIGWKTENPEQSSLNPVQVPAGFVTDFASIPAIFWSAIPPDGPYVYAAIIHDYLYWIQDGTRKEADDTLDAVMKEFEVGTKTRLSIYLAVRQFGDDAWDGNKELKIAGEKRILTRYPSDPRTKWEDWKKDSSNF